MEVYTIGETGIIEVAEIGKVPGYNDLKKFFVDKAAEQKKVDQQIRSETTPDNYVISQANEVFNLMKPLVGEFAARYAVYQTAFETNDYKDNKWKLHNNGSGITYAGQKGATKQPAGFPYAWFNNRQNYANAYAHELTKGSNPAGAGSLEEFVHRLKQNKYMEADENSYLFGLRNKRMKFASYKQNYSGQDPNNKNVYYDGDGNKSTVPPPENWWDSFLNFGNSIPWYGKVGIGLGIVVVAKSILSNK